MVKLDNNQKFLIRDKNGMDKVAIALETINIATRNYEIYGIYNEDGNYDIYAGIITYDEKQKCYILTDIDDDSERIMVGKIFDFQIKNIKKS